MFTRKNFWDEKRAEADRLEAMIKNNFRFPEILLDRALPLRHGSCINTKEGK